MRFTTFTTPLGELLLVGDDAGLRRLSFLDGPQPAAIEERWQRDDESFAEAREQLLGYLEGRRRSFSLDVAPGGNDFQRDVWAALVRIPYGETRTYGGLARRLGRDKAASAVRAANDANPLPLLIPCHRVVAAAGVGGYSGGEALKQRLLDLKGARPGNDAAAPARRATDILPSSSPSRRMATAGTRHPKPSQGEPDAECRNPDQCREGPDQSRRRAPGGGAGHQ